MGYSFDQPISGAVFATLPEQTDVLGAVSIKPIIDVVWAEPLTHLMFGEETFNHPISDEALPNSLEYLTFAEEFDQPITRSTDRWPDPFKLLALGGDFNHPVHRCDMARVFGVQLDLGECFNQTDRHHRLANVPQQDVYWANCFNQSIEEVIWPRDLLQTQATVEVNHVFSEGSYLRNSISYKKKNWRGNKSASTGQRSSAGCFLGQFV